MTGIGPSPELTEPVALCRPDGRLNPAAVGWSRRPLHDARLPGGWGRRKRWEFWAVQAGDLVLSITVADLDYLAGAAVGLIDLATGTEIEQVAAVPPWRTIGFPPTVGAGPTVVRTRRLDVALRPVAAGMRLEVEARPRRGPGVRADVVAAMPPGHETLTVVVPWSDRRFQLTSKHQVRPVEGTLAVGDTVHRLGSGGLEAWATLDHGRGRWPYRTRWNWASGSGRQGGHVVGLQLGAQWTDGTGTTENAVVVDGRLHRILEPVRFDFDRRDPMRPWHICGVAGDHVQLTLRPRFLKELRVPLGLLGARVQQCHGTFEGTIATVDGPLTVDGLPGWAEEMHARW